MSKKETVRDWLSLRNKEKLAEKQHYDVTSNKPYDESLIKVIGLSILQKFKLDETQLLVSNLEQFSKLWETKKIFDLHKKPLFCVFNKADSEWVTLCIREEAKGTVQVLYKDSFQTQIPDNFKLALENVFSNTKVQFILSLSGDQLESEFQYYNSGPLSLKNMEIIIESFKADNEKFVENFSKLKFILDDIDSIKTDFKVELVGPTIFKFLNKVTLVDNPEKLELFLNCVIKTNKGLGQVVNSYVDVLKEEMRKKEIDSEYVMDLTAIENAKGAINTQLEAFSPEMTSLCGTLKNSMPDSDLNFDLDEECINELQNKYQNGESTKEVKTNFENGLNTEEDFMSKSQLEQFKIIFNLLQGMKETSKLDELLAVIANKFGLNENILKSFFKMTINKANDSLKPKNEGKLVAPSVIELSKILPIMKARSSANPQLGKSVEHLLAELAIGRDIREDEMFGASDSELRSFFKLKYSNFPEILKLQSDFKKVKFIYEDWKDKDISEIRQWGESKIKEMLPKDVHSYPVLEAIAVMDRVFELTTGGHRFRNPQLISILEFLNCRDNQGKLCEISTGEGKTCIIAALATIRVLQGQVVDVLTSNEVLAREGVEEGRNFYSAFGLTCSTNTLAEGDASAELKPRECYLAHIVYGTISSFQFDYLRDTFEGHNTRSGRTFGSVILDEVDNLIIDNGSYIAKLAGPFPGMDYLKYVYIRIWQELHKAEQEVFGDITKKLDGISAELNTRSDLNENSIQKEYEILRDQIFVNEINSIKDRIIASKPTKLELIPSHLSEYCENMLEKWVDNALYAKYQCHENENYVIKQKSGEDCIVPVDYQNTGVTLKNTIWSNALHQFVQLKHNLELVTESVTSSFISNIGFIKLYKNQIFGLTGTLGSEAEKDLLSTTYNLAFATIGRFVTKRLYEVESKVVQDHQWLNLLSIEAFLLTTKKRSVLIICKTIKSLRSVESNIRALVAHEGKSEEIKIKTYEDESEFKVVHGKVGPGEIIIATNIAGRGTNFKTTPELELGGGLHVILAFLPCNQRVQDQAYGRTARQGNSGTVQLILAESDVLEIGIKIEAGDGTDFLKILKTRDEFEKIRLDKIKRKKLKEIEFQDVLFSKFSALYSKLKNSQRSKLGGFLVVEDLKEFWAFWLHNSDLKKKTLVEVDSVFAEFKEAAKSLLGDENVEGKISFNPYYSIRQAEFFLQNSMAEEAERSIQNAINLSGPNVGNLYSLYFAQFEIEIEKGGVLMERFKKALAKIVFFNIKKDEQYKEHASEALKKAINALNSELQYINLNIFGLTADGHEDSEARNEDFQNILTKQDENVLFRHLKARYVALSTFQQHADSLLKQLEESSGLDSEIGLCINSRIPHYLRKLDEKNKDQSELKAGLTNSSLSELESLGLDTIYSLRQVNDASKEVIIGAQVQIGLGLAAIVSGIAFPPIMPVMSPIAGALIAEGVCDIVIELLSRGQTGFDIASYVKGKCISYGIALATMGLSAIATSTKMLTQASKACKGLAALLRKCPYFKTVCEKLASNLEKLGNYFDKLISLAQFKRLNDSAKLQQLQELKAAGDLSKFEDLGGLQKFVELLRLKELGKLDVGLSRLHMLKFASITVGKTTVQSTILSLITDKVVTAGLNEILKNLKPKIEEMVRETLQNDARLNEKIKLGENEQFAEIVTDILMGTYGEMAVEILQDISLGVLRHSRNWNVKILSIVIDSVINISKIVNYVEQFLLKIDAIEITASGNTKSNADFKDMMDLTISQVTEKIYQTLIQLVEKYASTFAVTPIMTSLWNLGNRYSEISEDEAQRLLTFADSEEAHATLGLELGASFEEIRQAYKSLALKTHPDRKGGDSQAFIKVQNAFELLSKFHNKSNSSYTNVHQERSTLQIEYNTLSGTENSVSSSNKSNEEAHFGNIHTLSGELKHHIIVYDGSGKVIQESGTRFRNNGKAPLVVQYLRPTSNSRGHYTIPDDIRNSYGIDTSLHPTGENNCLYDALFPQINAQNILSPITAEKLREIGESISFRNLAGNFLYKASNVLNNQITRELYIKAHSALLVGGAMDETRGRRDNFINVLKDLNLPRPDCTTKSLLSVCANNTDAYNTILRLSPDFSDSNKTKINYYKITSFETLTSFIINFQYDGKDKKMKDFINPMALEFPNGNIVVFSQYLYAMVAYSSKFQDKVIVANEQYHGQNLGSIYNALSVLTNKNEKGELSNMPEICGRIISESIRNKSTFFSACLAMVKNLNTVLAGTYVDGSNEYPVTAKTGIIWEESSLEYINNPDFLLDRHLNTTKPFKNFEYVNKASQALGKENSEKNTYKIIYNYVKSALDQGDDPFPKKVSG